MKTKENNPTRPGSPTPCKQALNDIIKTINPNRHEIYIFGDMNINFLKFNEHAQTEEFLDMVYTNNILPIITKPTSPTPYFTLLEILKLENIFKLKIGVLVHKIQYQKKGYTSCPL